MIDFFLFNGGWLLAEDLAGDGQNNFVEGRVTFLEHSPGNACLLHTNS